MTRILENIEPEEQNRLDERLTALRQSLEPLFPAGADEEPLSSAELERSELS